MGISKKSESQIVQGILKFRPILENAKNENASKGNTKTIIIDMFSEIFGYDKYNDLLLEYTTKKTNCDFAIKVNDKISIAIACKSVNTQIKDSFVKQVAGSAAEDNIPWIIITNGIHWKIYKIIIAEAIDKELIFEFNIIDINIKDVSSLELIYNISKSAIVNVNNPLEIMYKQKNIVNEYTVSNLLLSDVIIDQLKKQIKKIAPELKITNETIKDILTNKVILPSIQNLK